MERISLSRKAGLPLESLSSLLNHKETDLDLALENRLSNINSEIQSLRKQQKFILTLLENTDSSKNSRTITKEVWVALLEASGLDEEGMEKRHIEFERTSPEAHQDFLESIGIDADEISEIREWSRKNRNKI